MPESGARAATSLPRPREGGRVLVDQLRLHGVPRVFGVPGESFLPVLDAVLDEPALPFITCRHEGAAAMAAEAHGKLTGRPGVCFVTRGPGAANASAGVHVARQDSTPMILFIGQVSTGALDREAFQEVDFRQMFAPLAKWAAQIDRADRIPEYVSRAFHVATSGRPGPVVLALPEDVLTAKVTVTDGRPYAPALPAAGAESMGDLARLLSAAERPVMIVGGSGWDAVACADLVAFAEAWALPTAAAFRCQDLFDNTHACYAGDLGLGANPALVRRLRDADLLLVVGSRFEDVPSNAYTVADIPVPRQTFVHVHPDPGELGRVYRPHLAMVAAAGSFAAAARALPAPAQLPWRPSRQQAHDDYLAWSRPTVSPGPLQLGAIVEWLRDRLPPDSIITNGAGNYTVWLHRFYRHRRYRTQLGPTSGSMGYGMPAALAACLAHPDRLVICFAGDGCFSMTGQELATAAQYGLRPIVLVINNGSLGTIRTHQERRYPGRVSATTLCNPDFAAWARAFGAHGETVTTTDEFAPAFERAVAAGRAALIELRLPVEALTAGASLSEIRAAASAAASVKP